MLTEISLHFYFYYFIERRASIIEMEYKLDKMDGENFELQARLLKFENSFRLNSEKLNGFKKIHKLFLVGYTRIHIALRILIGFLHFRMALVMKFN